jgi:nitrate reductase molybdenum cofactor assembly chaperone NarJ/NarW
MRTYKALGALLTYPEAALVAARHEIAAVLVEERLLPADNFDALAAMLEEIGTHDLLLLQERYVALFDRGRRLSLHLFEHVHGDSRDRGTAMIALAALYHAKGLMLATSELPDFLPLFLEFLSLCEPKEARAHLQGALPLIIELGTRLDKRQSPYAAVFHALEALAGGAGAAQAIRAEVLSEVEDDSFAALDKEWEEQPVTFGPSDGCSQVADVLRRLGPEASGARPNA